MKKILKYTIAIALTGSLAGCNKWLELKPQDGIVKEEFWKTKEQVEASVTGIYASLLTGASTFFDGQKNVQDRSLVETLFLWGEARADNVVPATRATNEDYELVNMNIQPSNSITNWRSIYRTINYCNTVIEKAPEVLKTDGTFTPSQLDQYVSEALTIRSLMYFYLVKSFGDVPLKLDATLSDQNLVPIAKTGRDSVLAQIVTDLKTAEKGAIFNFGNRNANKGRVTKFTVNAILADVYLWMDNYNDAIAECNKIINSGQFGLLAGKGNGSWFNSLYYEGNSVESIFEFQFDVQKLNPFYFIFTTGNRRWSASYRVMDELYTVDLNNAENKDIRADGSALRASDGTIWKLIAFDFNTLRSPDQSYAHWFVYRYADILLMKAEALNHAGRGAEALELVYMVRTRANALEATDLKPDPADKNAITDFILAERSREFIFEGKRWYDVLRNAKRNNYERLDLLLNMAAVSVPGNLQQSALNKLRDKNSHYFPIYFYELQTNKLLVQNSFYK